MDAEFNFKLLFNALKKNLIWIIAITVVVMSLFGAAAIVIPPTYSSSAKYISTNNKDGDDFAQSAIVSAQQDLVNDYIEIIKSREMMRPVSEKLKAKGLDYSPELLEKMVSGQQIKETSAFTVTVSSKNREHALIIAETISESVCTVIDGVQKRENTVAVLDPGTDPIQTEPSLVKNVIFGFLIGFFGSTLVFGFIALYDRTVRTEDDLKKRFNLPIIGVVPEWKS